MPVECRDCNHKFYLQGTDLDNIVSGGGCPACGGHEIYRTQVPPTESEMAIRNDVDPSTGKDMGGNPLTDGQLNDGGWRPRDRRDESFASVKTADGMDFGMMDFNFGDDTREATHKIIVSAAGGVYSLPEPTHHEQIADKFRLHELGYPQGLSLGILYNDGSTDWLQHDSGLTPQQMAERLESEFNAPVTIDPSLKPKSNERRWEEGGGEPYRPGDPKEQYKRNNDPIYEQQHQQEQEYLWRCQFCAGTGKWPNGTMCSSCRGTGRADKPRKPFGYNDNPYWNRGGSVVDIRSLNMEPYAPLWHQSDLMDPAPVTTPAQAQGGTSATVTPGAWGIHAGTVRWLQFFDASVNGLKAREQANEIIRRFGTRQGEEFGQPVELQVHFPEHLAAAAEAIEMSANGNAPTPKIKELLPGLQDGTVPFPPGMSAENIRTGKVSFLPALALGGLARGAIGGLMRGALSGIGSHMMQNALSTVPQQQPAAQPAPELGTPIPQQFARTADLETPSSVPSIGAQADDPEKVDPKELNDGEQATSFEGDTAEAGGSDGFPPDSEALQDFVTLLPKLLHFFNSEESAATDPILVELHHKLEQEQPGYLDDADDALVEELIKAIKQPQDHITAATPLGVMPATGPQGPMGPHAVPMQQNQTTQPCAYCGGVLTADGSCPQCGAKQNAQGGAVPGSQTPVGTLHPSLPPQVAATHQGPSSPEQLKVVAEFLLEQGRAEEIPHMLEAPWEYADVLAQIQNKPNDPPVDPTQPPQPAIEEAPPGATIPVADPTQQIAAAVARFSADSIAERCPNCTSATTGILNDKGDAKCHACGHTWRDKRIVPEKTADALHKHTPVEGVPVADQEEQRDVSQEQDSSLTWQTEDGQPLQVGQEYELHSTEYEIPDIIRITAVKPDAIEFEITGEYQDLEAKTEITHEEADLQGLSFIPVEAHDKEEAGEEDAQEYLEGDGERKNTVPTPAASTPFTTSVKEADWPNRIEGVAFPPCESCGATAGFNPYPFAKGYLWCNNCQGLETIESVAERYNALKGEHNKGIDEYEQTGQQIADLPTTQHPLGDHTGAADEAEEYEVLRCPNCTSTHVSSQMSSPTTTMHDCYRCAHFWETHEDMVEAGEDAARAWVMESSAPGEPDDAPAHMYAGLDFVPKSTAGKSRNLSEIARYAGRKMTPLEQRDLIDEDGEARNRDRLNLEGTHYRVRDDWTGKANGLNAPAEHLVLGL